MRTGYFKKAIIDVSRSSPQGTDGTLRWLRKEKSPTLCESGVVYAICACLTLAHDQRQEHLV